jgi:hypothetical protein
MINFTVLKSQAMKGIHYVTNAENKKIAVQIDLKKYGQLWEDFYDTIIVEDRKDEESIPWEDIKQELRKDGKLL